MNDFLEEIKSLMQKYGILKIAPFIEGTCEDGCCGGGEYLEVTKDDGVVFIEEISAS